MARTHQSVTLMHHRSTIGDQSFAIKSEAPRGNLFNDFNPWMINQDATM